MTHLLEVRNLEVQLKQDRHTVQAVNDVSYYIDEGEIVSIVGESGCGKSITQLSTIQLLPPTGKIVKGEVFFQGVDILKFKANSKEIQEIRGRKISFVFQEPMTSLNPVFTVGNQIIESLTLHRKIKGAAAREQAIELLKLVGIPDASNRIDNYPHQFSGGMRQRIMIAMALSGNPNLLIADEATTALDVTIQAQIMEILKKVVSQFNTSLLIVTHNLGLVARYSQRVYVMYAGRVVESGTTEDIFSDPRHPYTAGLLKAAPRLDKPKKDKLFSIIGQPPNLLRKVHTCVFLPRCPDKAEQCLKAQSPRLKHIEGLHYVACHAPVRNSKYIINMSDRLKEESKEFCSAKNIKSENILKVNNLKMWFPVTKGIFQHKVAELKAVDDVNFEIKEGETLGLVGESGCGKTTIARCILRLYRPTSGQIIFAGHDIARLSQDKLRFLRRKVQIIFQDPYSSLNPRHSAESIIGEPLKVNRLVKNNKEYQKRINELMLMVGLEPDMKGRYAHEFSGGQRQRIGIARALASEPSLLVCDEPISALDVSIQAQIINLLEDLQIKLGLTYLFIAHDLSVVRHISDRIAVMYLGRIIEITDWKSLYENPLHPYTQALLSAVPIPDPFTEKKRERILLKGEVPSLFNQPTGCPFQPRCPEAKERCSTERPFLQEIYPNHQVACFERF